MCKAVLNETNVVKCTRLFYRQKETLINYVFCGKINLDIIKPLILFQVIFRYPRFTAWHGFAWTFFFVLRRLCICAQSA